MSAGRRILSFVRYHFYRLIADMPDPLISIIIPTLNECDTICALTKYLGEQGGSEVEILVVDGGSTDGTCDALPEEQAKLVKTNPGRAVQMNCGASRARGQVLYFVHADTQVPASYVQDIKDALAAGFALGGYRTRFDRETLWLRINAYFTRFRYLWCRGGDQTLFITREAFEQLGGYREEYVIMEEYDLMRRARKLGLKFGVMPKDAIISARKYEYNSYLRVNVANLLMFQGFRLGVAPGKLRHWYGRLLRKPRGS